MAARCDGEADCRHRWPSSLSPVLASDRSWEAHFEKKAGRWTALDRVDTSLRKRSGLQGPIDFAFMDSFVMVKPTGQPMIPETAAWVNSEMNRAIAAWRSQFRGEAQVPLDSEVNDELIRDNNLILWGIQGATESWRELPTNCPSAGPVRALWSARKRFLGRVTL